LRPRAEACLECCAAHPALPSINLCASSAVCNGQCSGSRQMTARCGPGCTHACDPQVSPGVHPWNLGITGLKADSPQCGPCMSPCVLLRLRVLLVRLRARPYLRHVLCTREGGKRVTDWPGVRGPYGDETPAARATPPPRRSPAPMRQAR
jgi:hypothetical protein